MRLQNRVALVTGAGSGIGRAIAEAFAAEGAAVVVADIAPDRATETANHIIAAGGRAVGVGADVSDAASVGAMAEAARAAFGTVDTLVNNAGIRMGDTVLDTSEADWDRTLDVVLKGVYLCSRALLPGMIEHGEGVILNIGSINGLYAVGGAAYSAAKAGLTNLTANMAVHHGRHGVRVNAIAPGSVKTPIWAERVRKDPEVFTKLSRWIPLGRVGETNDIARAALVLCSDDAAWITGVTLPVDGGFLAGNALLRQDLGN
ncbi:MAG: glucose 1-dehydrogenase [Thermomicrobiales bacterium]|nr:glucose 1-dehydrogenase [Thermomicrobiales bacterium]